MNAGENVRSISQEHSFARYPGIGASFIPFFMATMARSNHTLRATSGPPRLL